MTPLPPGNANLPIGTLPLIPGNANLPIGSLPLIPGNANLLIGTLPLSFPLPLSPGNVHLPIGLFSFPACLVFPPLRRAGAGPQDKAAGTAAVRNSRPQVPRRSPDPRPQEADQEIGVPRRKP